MVSLYSMLAFTLVKGSKNKKNKTKSLIKINEVLERTYSWISISTKCYGHRRDVKDLCESGQMAREQTQTITNISLVDCHNV